EEFNTDQQVRERVVQALINSGVGWQQTGDGELAATVKGVGFTAEARTISYRPALARLVISEVRKGRGSLGTSMYPTRYLSTEEMLPFSPLPVLKSSVVPPGFSGWGEAWVDLARPSSSVKLLRNGEKYSPTMVVDRLGEPGCFTARGKPDPQAGCRRVGRTSQGPILRLPNSPDLTTIHDGHVVRLVGVWDYPAVDPWLSHQQAIGILRHLEVLQPAALSDGS
ncbi:MAG TPA: hypothetical protein PKK40_07030, partial [Marmoricola sp.]|nr:hypothetical protein [Marmoricola sp.]